MKFVCLLHESELQVTELTEYKGTDTSIRHIIYRVFDKPLWRTIAGPNENTK